MAQGQGATNMINTFNFSRENFGPDMQKNVVCGIGYLMKTMSGCIISLTISNKIQVTPSDILSC